MAMENIEHYLLFLEHRNERSRAKAGLVPKGLCSVPIHE